MRGSKREWSLVLQPTAPTLSDTQPETVNRYIVKGFAHAVSFELLSKENSATTPHCWPLDSKNDAQVQVQVQGSGLLFSVQCTSYH